MEQIYLNGEFMAKQDAKVSIFDRGFLFGDGIYEVIPVFGGKLLGFQEHLDRLTESLSTIYITLPYDVSQWQQIFQELLKRNQITDEDCNIYLQITRGADSHRNHAIPNNIMPTVVAFLTPSKSKSREMLAQGFAAVTAEDTRRRDCSVKAINLLPNILLYHKATQAGALEAILIRDGYAIEATSSNIFVVHDNQLFTPPLDYTILSGVTRKLVLELAAQNQISVKEQPIPETMLHNASEIWVTGSSKEICPIIKLDEKPVGQGTVGPMWHQIMDYYQDYKRNNVC